MTRPFHRLTIIGLGLIGSSVARAAHANGLASVIVGVDANELALGYARQQGFIHESSTDAASAVVGSDVVVIATPTHMLEAITQAIAPNLSNGALVMDTGSVKQLPLALFEEYLPAHALLVPSHPIAGSEQSGVQAGREDLFEKKRVIITPASPLAAEHLKRVNDFWAALGARVEAMPAPLHDMIYGYVSHLPQLLAFAVAPLIQASEEELAADPLLRRFLRLSYSDHRLWDGIFALNHELLSQAVSRYRDVIAHIRRELCSAPQEAPSLSGDVARLSLFPRIVASCLITTVMEAEKQAGIGFVRFSGSGFADFTAPATTDPQQDMEHISTHYQQLADLLSALEARLVL